MLYAFDVLLHMMPIADSTDDFLAAALSPFHFNVSNLELVLLHLS